VRTGVASLVHVQYPPPAVVLLRGPRGSSLALLVPGGDRVGTLRTGNLPDPRLELALLGLAPLVAKLAPLDLALYPGPGYPLQGPALTPLPHVTRSHSAQSLRPPALRSHPCVVWVLALLANQ
jgi:hypothetical protein